MEMHVSIIRRWIHEDVNNPVGAISKVYDESGRTTATGSATTRRGYNEFFKVRWRLPIKGFVGEKKNFKFYPLFYREAV